MFTKTNTGFTLIELLVTVVVLSVVLTVGVSGFQNSVRNARITTSVNDLVAGLQLARSEAIKRRVPIILCVTGNAHDNDNADCDTDASWADGWIAVVDNNRDGAFDVGADDEIILRHGALSTSGTVTTQLTSNDKLADGIEYEPSGFPRPYADGTAGGFILLCDDRNSNEVARLLNVSQTGRPAVNSIDRLPPDVELLCQAPPD